MDSILTTQTLKLLDYHNSIKQHKINTLQIYAKYVGFVYLSGVFTYPVLAIFQGITLPILIGWASCFFAIGTFRLSYLLSKQEDKERLATGLFFFGFFGGVFIAYILMGVDIPFPIGFVVPTCLAAILLKKQGTTLVTIVVIVGVAALYLIQDVFQIYQPPLALTKPLISLVSIVLVVCTTPLIVRIIVQPLQLYAQTLLNLRQEQIKILAELEAQRLISSQQRKIQQTTNLNLSQWLHDSVLQEMALLKFISDKHWKSWSAGRPFETRFKQEFNAKYDEIVERIRYCAKEINPRPFPLNSLIYSLKALIVEYNTLNNFLTEDKPLFSLKVTKECESLLDEILKSPVYHSLNDFVYNLVQRSANNALKYAQAKNVSVALDLRALSDSQTYLLQIAIADDGVGMPSESLDLKTLITKGSLGIYYSILEAQENNATLEYVTSPGQGMVVKMEIVITATSDQLTYTLPK